MSDESETMQTYRSNLSVPDEFLLLTTPFQHELLVHCYRFFGSLDDAEDALQETWLRAWRRIDSLKDQSALRAWLYKIATNVSLDMLEEHKARLLPSLINPPANPQEPLPPPIHDSIWIDPLPDEYLDWTGLNPEAHVEQRESVTLAFLTALQLLPGRQRAVLILRDVLGWKAQEAADLLNLSVAAVNSALQRARATLKKHQSDRAANHGPAAGPQVKSLLERYIQAWEAADTTGLVSLLREDAVWTMPPLPAWYRGRAAIKEFLEVHLFSRRAPDDVRLVATRANGAPAFAVYQLDENGVYRIGAFQILTIEREKIVQIDSFLTPDRRQLAHFNLPDSFDR